MCKYVVIMCTFVGFAYLKILMLYYVVIDTSWPMYMWEQLGIDCFPGI